MVVEIEKEGVKYELWIYKTLGGVTDIDKPTEDGKEHTIYYMGSLESIPLSKARIINPDDYDKWLKDGYSYVKIYSINN